MQDQLKRAVAESAIDYVGAGEILGVGTGSTVNYFIEALVQFNRNIKGAVASSFATAEKLKASGICLFDLNQVDTLPVYIDSADEITMSGAMIKGGGAALTHEKIIAAAAQKFVCIADHSKLVDVLGHFPLPIAVVPMAHDFIMRQLMAEFDCQVSLRLEEDGTPLVTDNGCYIIDVKGLQITEPMALESRLNNLAGVVTAGLFAHRGADICLLGTPQGIKKLEFR